MARILVIEDDPAFRRLVCKYLEHIGYEVLTASNGLEGVEAFRSCPDLIDLVLTDLRMPVMRGDDAVRHIWKTKPDAKVICMTASQLAPLVKGIRVLTKPFSLKELSNSIFHLLEQRGQPCTE